MKRCKMRPRRTVYEAMYEHTPEAEVDRLTAELEEARRRITELEIALADAENRARMAKEDADAMRGGGETYAELYWRNRAEAAEAAESGLRTGD